ncbi:MAG: hypothetical protein RUDDFDWM_001091 [Candidatus Fervidibacterota bacterium]
MVYTPYDWAQMLRQKADYVEDRLRLGSPVVALSCHEGVLIVTIRWTQRKIYEAYDKLAFAALGQQADIEAIRMLTIDFVHVEGFQRSPEDVSIQRVVGFAISPALRRAFSDPFRAPFVLRALLAQVGDRPEEDVFYVVNYDGEFAQRELVAAICGMPSVEEDVESEVRKRLKLGDANLHDALNVALVAWALGKLKTDNSEASKESVTNEELHKVLMENLSSGKIEAALLERHSQRERRFRLLSDNEIKSIVAALQ